MWKKAAILLPVVLLLAGCATTITNISARRQVRNPDQLYPIEVSLDSRQQSLIWETVQPTIIVGRESYPMRPVKHLRNRWEGLIPVPAGVNTVTYHYKFNYQYNGFGKPQSGSASSKSYKLQIVEP